MTTQKLKEMVDHGAHLASLIETFQTELKEIKKALAAEAASRPSEHEPAGDSDGTVWQFRTDKAAVAVTFPTDTLKESISIESKLFEKIEVLVPTHDVACFFDRVNAVKPRHDFRAILSAELGPKVAEKVLKLCTSASSPSVKFKPVSE